MNIFIINLKINILQFRFIYLFYIQHNNCNIFNNFREKIFITKNFCKNIYKFFLSEINFTHNEIY